MEDYNYYAAFPANSWLSLAIPKLWAWVRSGQDQGVERGLVASIGARLFSEYAFFPSGMSR